HVRPPPAPALRALHSFPTRRSSDLAIEHELGQWALRLLLLTLAVTPLRQLTGQPVLLQFRRMLGLYAFAYASLHFAAWLGLDLRSEEHTSELQSRENLVCRLLLEKK